MANAERATERVLRRALSRDGDTFVLQRQRAHAVICSAAHPQVKQSDVPFEAVQATLGVIKNAHGDPLDSASWREFSNGAGSATVAAALMHNFNSLCTDYHAVASDDDALPPSWYTMERFQAYGDMLDALRQDNNPDDHLERMTPVANLRYLPRERAFDGVIDRSDTGETSVVFIDLSTAHQGGGPTQEHQQQLVNKACDNIPSGSYVVTFGGIATVDALQVRACRARRRMPGGVGWVVPVFEIVPESE